MKQEQPPIQRPTIRQWLSPEGCQHIALIYDTVKLQIFIAALIMFAVYGLLSMQITPATPLALIQLTLFVQVIATECTIMLGFVFYFRRLFSIETQDPLWAKMHRIKEWLQIGLFLILFILPLVYFLLALASSHD